MRKLVLIFFLLTGVAFAQFTTVTGTVIDPNNVPYALGTITPLLILNGGSPTLNGQPYSPPTQAVGLDLNGHFSFNVADNNVLLPSGSKWNFTVCSAQGTVQPAIGKGSVCFTLAVPLTITGATQSISTQLNAAALPLTIPLGTGGSALPAGVAPGSVLVSNGVGALVPPIYQIKPSYDIRDWGFVCDGVTYNTLAAQTLVNAIAGAQANVQITLPNCGIGDFVSPKNIALDYLPGGSIKTLTDSTTVPGNGAYDAAGSGQCQHAAADGIKTCIITVTPTAANETYLLACMHGFSSGTPGTPTSTVAGDIFLTLPGTATTQASIVLSWLIPNVTAGARTFTVTFPGNLVGACSALAVSGLGPTPYLDGAGNNGAGNTSPMSSGAASFLAGSMLFSFGGNDATVETCTAGAGFTQPAGLVGNSTAAGSNFCTQFQASAAGGSATATQTLSAPPTGTNWAYQIIGLRPSSAHIFILGGINNPDSHQIFLNATGTAGIVDFTGNLVPLNIYPEWWGASATATATTNTAALQAAEHGAYGTNRFNGSGLNQYNKNLILSQNYQINGELQFYDVMGLPPGARAQMICQGGGGITQTATNQRVLDQQATEYFDKHGCSFQTTASQDATHPLIDDDFDGVTVPSGSPPQFETCYDCTFNGNSQAAIGVLGAKSGSGAQYSNEYCLDCEMIGFTQACWQIGTPAHFAQNALAIGYSGDMQSCPGSGLAVYGGGYVSISAGSNGISTMENGFSTQTGFDIFGSGTQGPCVVEHFRSESRKFASCPTLRAKDVLVINQANFPIPGQTFPIGQFLTGSLVTGDGAGYKVTNNGGPFSGAGTPSAPLTASSGTATTLVDTNNSIPGSVTIKSFVLGDLVTQAVTGSTGTITVVPSSFSTITGTLTAGTFQNGETVTQAVTGITATFFGTGTPTAMFVQNLSGTADNSHTWTGGSSGATFNPSTAPVASVASPSMVISSPTGAPDGTHNWTNAGGATYVPTGAPVPQAAWTVNAFTGMLVGVLTGTNALCYGVITSNAATSVTLSAGWLTKYQFTSCSAPDSTSNFLIDANWNHGTVTDGGMTLVYQNENTIQGGPSAGMQGTLEDVNVPLGQVYINGNPTSRTVIKNLTVSRADWYVASGGNDPQSGFADRDWDVNAFLLGGSKPISWAYPAIVGTPYFGALHRDLGAKVVCWSAGTIGLGAPLPANNSANDVCIGGRSDLGASNDPTRNILEIPAGMIGRPAPQPTTGNSFNPTNIAGTDFDITGGPSTGNAPGGAINFYTSTPGASGSTPNSGLKRGRINTGGQFESLLSGNLAGFITPSGPVSGTWQCTNVTPVTVSANVATDQNLMACTIPAGTLNSASRTLRVYVAGIYSTPAASTSVVTVSLKLCTVSGCGAGTVITPISIASAALGAITATNDPFSLAAYSTTQTTGAASAYEAHGNLTIDISALASAAEAVYADNNTATVGTIDATAQLFLQITIAFSNASASNAATERQLIVDSVN